EGAGAFRHEAEWLQARRLVRTITEGLLGRAPARAPEIRLAGFQGHLVGALLGAERFIGHLTTPQATLSFNFSTTLTPASSAHVNSNSPGPGTFMKKER